jgi:hypothetical protein
VLIVWTPLSAEVPANLYNQTPLAFEPNQGQAPEEVQFLSRGNGYGLFLTETEAVLTVVRPEPATVRMSLVGQNAHPRIEAVDRQGGVSNHLTGGPETWRKGIPHFSKVRYSDVYPGIDVVYYGNQRQLEYDFLLAPGSDSRKIRMEFGGVRHLSIAPDGDLILRSGDVEIRHRRPIAYQDIRGTRSPVEVSFVLRGARRAGFEVGAYDPAFPLVIDPKMAWSSFLGGTGTDAVLDVEADDSGNVYLAGYTLSPDFWAVGSLDPTPGGRLDAFIVKMHPGASILYSTYIGGAGDDEAHSIALSSHELDIHITGFTGSQDFPIVNPFKSTFGGALDAYIVTITNDGSTIKYSSFLGGNQADRGTGVAADLNGYVVITGTTSSRNFTIHNAFRPAFAGGLGDAFLTKVSPWGTLVYSTYLGGVGNDVAYDVAVDSEGHATLIGFTSSPNFPTERPLYPNFRGGSDDAFITKFNPAGNGLVFSTYFGGSGSDNGVGVAIDSNNNIIATGYTESLDFPLKRPAQLLNNGFFDAFLVKLHPDGQDADFSTYIGGEDTESGVGVDIGPNDEIYLVGYTNSFNFYAINAVGGFLRGARDAFLMKITPDASVVVLSSFLGGFGIDGATGVAVDNAGNAYVGGFTLSADFPVATNAFQPGIGGGQDGFILRIESDDIVTSSSFSIPPAGATSIATAGQTARPIFGYAAAETTGGTSPAGIEIVDLRSVGVLVNEISVPATVPLWTGRFLARTSISDNTAVSMTNPTDVDVRVDYYFTDQAGEPTHFGFFVLPARAHVSALLRDQPFNVPLESFGTLTFGAEDFLYVTALRVDETGPNPVNSWVPIIDPYDANDKLVTVPVFSDGEGWSSQFYLINLTEDQIEGEVRLYRNGPAGEPGVPVEIPTELGVNSVFSYSIPRRSMQAIFTRGESSELITGFADIVPHPGNTTPFSFALLTHTGTGGYMRTTVEALEQRQSFSSYVESSGAFPEALAATPSVAIANRADAPATVQLTLNDSNGVFTGLSASLTLPPKSNVSKLLRDIPGFENLPSPFQGVLHITTSDPWVTAMGFRSRYNERELLLMVATGPMRNLGGRPAVFPHVVDGGGYATQFLLVNDSGGSTGSLKYLDQSGNPLNVAITP